MANLAAVFQAHHRRLLTVQAAVGANMGAIWDRLANVDQVAAAKFTKAAATLSTASVATTASLNGAMFDVVAPDTDRPVRPVVIRNGADPADVYQRSIMTARYSLSKGLPWAAAMAAGRARAVSTARTDVMLANRAASDAQGAARPDVNGFARLLDPGACAYCAALGDEHYTSADDVPLHNNCGCSVIPIIGRSDTARTLNRQTIVSTLKNAGADELASRGFVTATGDPIDPEDVPADLAAVHQHGEMGPVIRPAGEHFTTAAEED